MIDVANVTKRYPVHGGERTILNGISFQVRPHERLGILGRNGSGKSTLIRLLSGVENPSSGTIRRSMNVSWPLAFAGGFQGTLTGMDNLRFICRIYNTTFEDKIPFVQDFSELGRYLREPVKSYSAGMRARLAFALSMIIEFDCFLIDEVIAVGDARFRQRCQYELFEKRGDRAMILVSHSPAYIKAHCHRVCVLLRGQLHGFSEVEEGFAFYNEHAAEQ